MNEIEVGQIVYVHVSNMFYSSEPKLIEYIVSKVNTRSFYAHRKDSDYERRFDKRKMTHESLGEVYRAYLTEKEYWDMVDRRKESIELRKELKKQIDIMSLEKLHELKKHIN
ncbi:hypothetical protein JC777_00900 [Bacillus cytotoxicus]|uniref:Uncharacterized protein n=1 Tax=Bacillus cytotoxicus TaxID=580165 RepID=A0AAX2CKN8_9BACI|nr:hypothetical protein [Bacillus cytotoxicus]QTR83177.1 hypothetical protein JC777_00900 [Bacillus cytotoxicus]QTR86914.1 hypothetical protein JC774_20915 [Bacillus cytotoxicus]SCM00549.1 Uncharacterized protein BCB44BAC_03333 [Bacillus cytotoxicus]